MFWGPSRHKCQIRGTWLPPEWPTVGHVQEADQRNWLAPQPATGKTLTLEGKAEQVITDVPREVSSALLLDASVQDFDEVLSDTFQQGHEVLDGFWRHHLLV